MRSSYLAACAVALIVLLLPLQAAVEAASATAGGAAAANCDRQDLATACKEATVTGNPDAHCCDKLKQHEPCLCEYLKDPVEWKFVNTDKGHQIFDACHVKFPSYCPPPSSSNS